MSAKMCLSTCIPIRLHSHLRIRAQRDDKFGHEENRLQYSAFSIHIWVIATGFQSEVYDSAQRTVLFLKHLAHFHQLCKG